MHKKVCSDQGRRSGNRHADLRVLPIVAQCGPRSATLPWTLFLWVCCCRTTFPGCFYLSENSPTEERLDHTCTSNEHGWANAMLSDSHAGKKQALVSYDSYVFFCFVLFCAFCFGIGKGKQFTKKTRFWPRPSVVVHSSCYPIGKSSGRCPKRRGGPWPTPSQSLRSPTSRSDFDDDNPITGHASCLRWTSAVQCWQADLMVRHLWGFRWAFVSHECDRFFQHRFWQTRSESDRLAQTASKIDHASHTLFHVHNVDMYALGQLWIWCDWCEVPRLKAATLVNISETSACIETVSLFLWHSFTWQTELSLCPVF